MAIQLRQLATGSLALMAGYESGHLTLWNVQENKVLVDTKLYDDPVLSVDMDSTCTNGLSGSAGTNIVVFSFDLQKVPVFLTIVTNHTVDMPNYSHLFSK
jgi:hypothetical protein